MPKLNCPECGAEVVGEAVFCHRCGERVDELLPESGQGSDAPMAEQPQKYGASISRAGAAESGGRQGEFAPRGDDDDSEEELWSGGYSSKAMIPHAIGWAILSVVLLVVAIMIPWEGGLKWAVFLGGILLGWIGLGGVLAFRRLDVDYRLTTQRFVHKSGILRRTTDRIEVIDMDDVTYTQGIIERMIGVGTVRVTSSDRTHPEILLRGIDGVHEVSDKLDAARRKERVRRGLHIEAV